MTTGIAPTCNKATEVAAVQNQQAAASAAQSESETKTVSNENNDAASVECSGRKRVRGHGCHHHRHHCDDGSVGEIVDDLSRLTKHLGKVQAKIDQGELSADDLELAQGDAANLTEKIKKIVNSDEFKKASAAVKAVLDAYNSDGEEAALDVARENRDVLGHDLVRAVKHGRIGRLEKIASAFNSINSIVNPEPPAEETPVTDDQAAPVPVAEPTAATTQKTVAKTVKTSTAAVAAVTTEPVATDSTAAADTSDSTPATPTTPETTEPAPLDVSALSKALSGAWKALSSWRHRGGHEGHHFGHDHGNRVSNRSDSLFDQQGLTALANRIKANQDTATAAATGLDPLKSLDLLQVQ